MVLHYGGEIRVGRDESRATVAYDLDTGCVAFILITPDECDRLADDLRHMAATIRTTTYQETDE